MHDLGRLAIYYVNHAGSFPIRLATFYGWTGSDQKQQAKKRTVELMHALFQELQASTGPFLVVGDLNAQPAHIQPVHERLMRGEILDTAACMHLTGHQEPLVTCMGHRSSNMQRKDFIFASNNLLQFARSVYTIGDYGLDVHVPVCIEIELPKKATLRTLVTPPLSSHQKASQQPSGGRSSRKLRSVPLRGYTASSWTVSGLAT
eukprot:13059366-Alexandrium_andersonii.AAC.1